MSKRFSNSFAPSSDEFTSFNRELLLEEQEERKNQGWFSNAAKFLFTQSSQHSKNRTTENKFHELMVSVLSDSNTDGAIQRTDDKMKGLNVEKYILSFLPSHLIRAGMFVDVSKLLLDFEFIDRRIKTLGSVDATKRLTIDLSDLRRQYQKNSKESRSDVKKEQEEMINTKSEELDELNPEDRSNAGENTLPQEQESIKIDFDVVRTQREACRRMIDAVRRAEYQSSSSSTSGISINVAICVSIIAEFSLKAKMLRDAVARFDESLDLFRKLLGKKHVDVARILNGLGRAYIKAGDNSRALTRLTEAYLIYEACQKLHQYDAISNNLLIASLFVENGDWEKATERYDEVISMKEQEYGKESLSVAKTINEYAIVLAKHNRMSESLRQYERARDLYLIINTDDRFSFDVTLIELNIASIKSKLGNFQGALESYERGVEGLRAQMKKEKEKDIPDNDRLAAQQRHLVSAMGRIGSMRMKLKDNTGALKTYLTLIKEVDKKSPTKARAHVKCATIFRQAGSKESNAHAVSHLTQALQMYTVLHGADHKDTIAIGSSLKQWQKTDSTMVAK